MKYRKRLAAVALALAVFFSLGVNAYAEEIPAPTTEETTQADIELSNSIPEEDTLPPAEDPPATEEQETDGTPIVHNIEELQAAIDAANDGDTILIGTKITCAESITVGSVDKEITLAFSDDFSDNSMFFFLTKNAQEISLQNLILSGETADDHNAFAITSNIFSTSPDTQGRWNFENVTFEQFTCAGAVITVFDADATFTNCCIQNNYGRHSGGIEINSDSSVEVTGCSFTDNQSVSNGAAIRCRGYAKLSESSITGNYAINDGTVKNGGGIYVDTGASCEVLSCTITGNTADSGGGIGCMGTLTLRDTLIYGNTGNLGGSDIRGFDGANIVVDYTDGMDAVYAENSPIGFYKDDFESTFDAETKAEFVGETISIQSNANNNFGVKFIFEGDLPVVTPDPTPDDDSDDLPQELPSDPVPDTPTPPVIEIVPIPTPEPDPQPTPTPDPVPTPTQPIDPPEESEDIDTEEEQPIPIVGTDNTRQEPEEETPPVTATDNDLSAFEEEQDKQPVQETVADDDSIVDLPAPDVDNDKETETPELPIEDEAVTETEQPEQEEQTAPVMIDKGEEQSAPLGIIITAVTLLSASGAICFIKRKR